MKYQFKLLLLKYFYFIYFLLIPVIYCEFENNNILKGANYTLNVNSKIIEDNPYSHNIILNNEVEFISNFDLNEIFKSFTKSEENDTFNINVTFYDDDELTERNVSANNWNFINIDSKLEYKLENFIQEVRAVTYNEVQKYFYIFTATNIGEKCSEKSINSILASIIFYLNTPPTFGINMDVSFGDKDDDYECLNSTSNNNNLYTCYEFEFF